MALWLALIGLLVVALVAGVLVRRHRARRAGEGLERDIALQGALHAAGVRPERRAEVEALQRQLAEGIAALKRSKLGRWGLGGSAALYAMPWYVVIGPPGAGKTTALKQSGLDFPLQSGASAVRGVGGTRNCDWWFTNEAILLDTAGRYATREDDRPEWLKFLQLLRKYRPSRPIQGVVVAISVAEVLEAGAVGQDAVGAKIRARVDEVMRELGMRVPVYLLFTKTDLVEGFAEFFADMKRLERTRPWGATLAMGAEARAAFEGEFDELVRRLHARSLRRMVTERDRAARERIYRYPVEFARLRAPLSALVHATFAPNRYQHTPALRGFYFTSAEQAAGSGDTRSYFLRDVFSDIIFRDANLAVETTAERRRRLLSTFSVAATLVALAGILVVPAVRAYLGNEAFLGESRARAAAAANTDWSSDGAASEKLTRMQPLLEQLRALDQFEADGVPMSMGWGMFVADRARTPLLRVYVAQMQAGFVTPVRASLEADLEKADGSRYLEHRRLLKLYLMLADPDHLDVEWATGQLTPRWVDRMHESADRSSDELRDLARPHVRYYFELLAAKRVAPLGIDEAVVARVRAALRRVPVQERYYGMFVGALLDERIDPAADDTADNLVFPPVRLPDVFRDRREVLDHVESRTYLESRRYPAVEGPYTERGRAAVMELLGRAGGVLESEAWVVAPTADETPAQIPKHLRAVTKRYEREYMRQWVELFADVRIRPPADVDAALDRYRVLSTTPYPVGRLLEVLENETQWRSGNVLSENDAVRREANRRFNNRLQMYTGGVRLDFDLGAISRDLDVIPQHFKKTVSFIHGAKGQGSGGDSRMFLYAEELKRLRAKIAHAKAADPDVDLRALNDAFAHARLEAERQLEGYDDVAKRILTPLLLGPLDVGAAPSR